MRLSTNRTLRIAAFGLALVACNSDRVTGPAGLVRPPVPARDLGDAESLAGGPSVRISEFHYDNASTDVGEAIEISGPAGTVLNGWKIVKYNGGTSGVNKLAGTVYDATDPVITGTIPSTPGCGTRGVLVVNYPTNGLQNGPNDGFALVNAGGTVIEFLSYAGPLTAAGPASAANPAGGMAATDVGVAETGTVNGTSIKRSPTGTWSVSSPQSFGVCNDDDSGGATQTLTTIDVTPTPATITAGGTQQFTATAKDQNGAAMGGVTFTWGTSNASAATVNASGLAMGVAAGDANITATSGTVVGTAALHVNAAPVVTTIVVTPTPATINQGGTQQFTATAKDASNNTITGVTFTWATSAATVATVNASGLATGVGNGDASITATSGSVVGTAALHVNGAAPYIPPDIRFSEIHYDNSGTDVGEAIEIEGPVGTSLAGWSILLYDGSPTSGTPLKMYSTTSLTGSLTAPIACNTRGVLSVPYPVNGIQNGGTAGGQPDGFALVDNNGVLVEFLSYEGSFTAADGAANGVTSRNIVAMEDNPVPGPDKSLHRSADGATWSSAAAADFGYVNACGGPPPSSITFSGRSPTADPPLPVGFEAQVFASESVNGSQVNTTFTWTSETPAIASVDQSGVLHALAAGTAVLRATATDGATATYSLPTLVGTQSAAPYGGNTEFGDPVDADPSNDFIIRRLEYSSSWNGALGRPNWVSEKLDATTYGAQDRCNCFTFDPELEAAGFAKYTTADYTGAGSFAGYGIDRGHMTRSFDRTAGNLDNARTYYFSNVLPQAAANNQVTWKLEEDTLGTIAQSGKEVYVISGGSSSAAFPSKGFIKGQNKVEMPGAVWKVAVIMAHGKGLADVQSVADLQIIAIITPNDPSVNPDWHVYKTTVDAVEALSGYDLLSLLPDNIENAVESGDTPPVAAVSGATSGAEGSSLSFSASGSTDADVGDVLTYSWTFGDGGTATGVAPSHTFNDNGTYTVTVRVTDSHNVYSDASLVVTVSNVAPTATISATPSTLVEGSPFTISLGSASDPSLVDAGSLTYAFDCGDGVGFRPASASASFTCTPDDNGVRTVNATVLDKDGGSTSYSSTVTVSNAAPVITSFSTPAGPSSGATVAVSFSDAGAADTHTAVITWGDGQTSTVSAGLATSASATHTYANAGFFTVSATVTDDDGASVSTGTRTLAVYDAAAGYTTASGYVQGVMIAQKTYFSHDVRYTGGTTPTGTFEIHGTAAANMTSSAFEYLVVQGTTGTFRGTGTLTNGTPVTFIVRGIDNKPTLTNRDKIRIKVWNTATNAVIYDSMPNAADFATPTANVVAGSYNILH